MKIIETHNITPGQLSPWEAEQCYNGLDCCVTAEVLDVLLPQLDEHTSATYDFSRALQGPALEMRLRGVKVDRRRKNEVIDEYREKIEIIETNLERIVREGLGYFGFNWRSNPDLQKLFYDYLGIPVIKKQGRPTVDRNALEKLDGYTIAQPFVMHLVALRELKKKIEFLQTAIDPDGRIRTSYNIAGTNTGRFSSSYSEFGTGTNLQNVEEALRSVFISDQGMKMAKFDAAQGESYVVGGIEWNLFKDGRYLDACETGDLHTTVARMCWPSLAWTGILETDRKLAEQPYYRHYDRRFMCKKIGHGTNYLGQPDTLSIQAKVEKTVIEQFQPLYFKAFPARQRWHYYVENQIWTTGYLISLMGRKRWFFGRRNDKKVLREAVAYDPQGSLADIVNAAMLRIWHANNVQLLMQDHDAITVQYPEEREDEIIPLIQDQLRGPVALKHGRTLLIPYDCQTGWNKGKFSKVGNPDGLKSYIPGDQRRRTKAPHILDTVVHRVHRKFGKS